jgi:hypothetical protein
MLTKKKTFSKVLFYSTSKPFLQNTIFLIKNLNHSFIFKIKKHNFSVKNKNISIFFKLNIVFILINSLNLKLST